MRRQFSRPPFTEVKTTWCVPLSGLVAQLPAASAAAQATAAVSVRLMRRLPFRPAPGCGGQGAAVPTARPERPLVRSSAGRRSSAHPPFAGPIAKMLPGELPRAGRGGVLLAELVHAARGVDDLLLAGIER